MGGGGGLASFSFSRVVRTSRAAGCGCRRTGTRAGPPRGPAAQPAGARRGPVARRGQRLHGAGHSAVRAAVDHRRPGVRQRPRGPGAVQLRPRPAHRAGRGQLGVRPPGHVRAGTGTDRGGHRGAAVPARAGRSARCTRPGSGSPGWSRPARRRRPGWRRRTGSWSRRPAFRRRGQDRGHAQAAARAVLRAVLRGVRVHAVRHHGGDLGRRGEGAGPGSRSPRRPGTRTARR